MPVNGTFGTNGTLGTVGTNGTVGTLSTFVEQEDPGYCGHFLILDEFSADHCRVNISLPVHGDEIGAFSNLEGADRGIEAD